MEITFTGKAKNVSRKLYTQAINFYSEKLLSPKLRPNVCINIVFEAGLTKPPSKIYGYCDFDDFGGPPRMFRLHIDAGLSKRMSLLTLAHEMTHMKQYAIGELKDYVKYPNKIKWKGEIIEKDSSEYWDAPWEIEALGREQGLYNMFKWHLKND